MESKIQCREILQKTDHWCIRERRLSLEKKNLSQTAKSRCPEKKLLVLRPVVPEVASSHTLSPVCSRSTMSPDDIWRPPR